MNDDTVMHEIKLLLGFMRDLGIEQKDGSYEVTFGTLFTDETLSNTLESLAGTLKAAKKRKIVSYKPELLLQGMSNNEVMILLPGKLAEFGL